MAPARIHADGDVGDQPDRHAGAAGRGLGGGKIPVGPPLQVEVESDLVRLLARKGLDRGPRGIAIGGGPGLPAPDAVAALHVHGHGYVAAGELTRALVSAAIRRGAAFDIGTVTSVEGGAVARVRTAAAVIESDVVVVAAGSWSTGVHGVAATPDVVRPIRGQLLQLRLPHRCAERVIWGSDCYLVARQDGTVLAGATVEDVGFDERATSAGVQQLLGGAISLMPALRAAVFEEVRVGLRPKTRDELPAVGASSTMPQVFYATGHYRNGVLLAPLTARLVADLVLGGKGDESRPLLDPQRLGL